MTRTVDDVLRDIDSCERDLAGSLPGDVRLLRAEILALRAERDTWREGARGVTAELAAVADALGAQTDVLECARDIRAERDALRDSVSDMDRARAERDHRSVIAELEAAVRKHHAVIARAREAGE